MSSLLLLLAWSFLLLLLSAAHEAVKGLLADWLKARLQAVLRRRHQRRAAGPEPRPLAAPTSRATPAWERIANAHDILHALRRRTTP